MLLIVPSSLNSEFTTKLHPLLRGCLLELDRAFFAEHGKHLTVTDVWRSIQRQIEICKEHQLKSDFKHSFGEAVDIRSKNLIFEEIQFLECFVTSFFGSVCSLKYHEKGTAPHLHMNLIGQFSQKEKIKQIVKQSGGEKYLA